MATKKQTAPASVGAALVLCAGAFDGVRPIPAGAIVEGVPAEVLSDNAYWLDAHPGAVASARASGAPVLQYAD